MPLRDLVPSSTRPIGCDEGHGLPAGSQSGGEGVTKGDEARPERVHSAQSEEPREVGVGPFGLPWWCPGRSRTRELDIQQPYFKHATSASSALEGTL